MFAVVLTLFLAVCSATENAEEQSTGCTLCQLVIQYVETYLAQNATEQEIIQKLEAFCANIPVFGPECDSIVSSYLPQMIQWIIKKEPPQTFCTNVRVCASPQEKEQEKETKKTSTIPCSLCQMAASYVEKWVSEKSTEQEIAQRLESFCTIVGPLSPECQSFVAIYVPKLIDWIVSKENPDAFCTQVHLCQSEVEKKEVGEVNQNHRQHMNRHHRHQRWNHHHQRQNNKQANKEEFFTYKGRLPKTEKREEDEDEEEEQSAGCQVCQLIVTYVEQLVANNNTVSEIVAKVEGLCGLLGPNLSPICDQIAVKYVPSLVQWIIKKENPQAFCSQVHLC